MELILIIGIPIVLSIFTRGGLTYGFAIFYFAILILLAKIFGG